MRPLSILAISSLVAVIQALSFLLDCTKCPQSCNNDCYAIFVAGATDTLNYDKASADVIRARRRASGCKQSNGLSACGVNGIAPYNSYGDSCDEYPYASTSQGGTGAILRCVSTADNSAEGSQLGGFYAKSAANGGCGSQPCQFTLMFQAGTYDNSPFCVSETGPNDGAEFKLQNGQYVNAKTKRQVSYRRLSNAGYEEDKPEPALYVPLTQRREFLLDNGNRALLLSGDMEAQYNGTLVAGEERTAIVVRELFGDEKSLPFRPASM